MTVIPEKNDCVLDQGDSSGVVRSEYSEYILKKTTGGINFA